MTSPVPPASEVDTSDEAMMESHLVETTDEDGNVHLFEKLDEFELDDERYALLVYMGEQPEGGTLAQAAEQLSQKMSGADNADGSQQSDNDSDHDEELVIMKVSVGDDGADWLEEIETEAEYDKVVAHLEHRQDSGDLLFELDITDNE